eukprot:CFRG2919T1
MPDEGLRPALKGVLAAILFSTAWWLWIDAYVYTRVVISPEDLTGSKLDVGWMAGVISSAGLIMVNLVPAELLGGGNGFGDDGEGRARLFFIIALMTSFGGLTAAIVITSTNYVNDDVNYIATAIIVQNVLILFSSLILRIHIGESDSVF